MFLEFFLSLPLSLSRSLALSLAPLKKEAIERTQEIEKSESFLSSGCRRRIFSSPKVILSPCSSLPPSTAHSNDNRGQHQKCQILFQNFLKSEISNLGTSIRVNCLRNFHSREFQKTESKTKLGFLFVWKAQFGDPKNCFKCGQVVKNFFKSGRLIQIEFP